MRPAASRGVDDVSPGALAPISTGPTGRGLAGAAGPVAGELLARLDIEHPVLARRRQGNGSSPPPGWAPTAPRGPAAPTRATPRRGLDCARARRRRAARVPGARRPLRPSAARRRGLVDVAPALRAEQLLPPPRRARPDRHQLRGRGPPTGVDPDHTATVGLDRDQARVPRRRRRRHRHRPGCAPRPPLACCTSGCASTNSPPGRTAPAGRCSRSGTGAGSTRPRCGCSSDAWPAPPPSRPGLSCPRTRCATPRSPSRCAGAPLRDVQDFAGHRDPRTTRRYDRARDTPSTATPRTPSPPTWPELSSRNARHPAATRRVPDTGSGRSPSGVSPGRVGGGSGRPNTTESGQR